MIWNGEMIMFRHVFQGFWPHTLAACLLAAACGQADPEPAAAKVMVEGEVAVFVNDEPIYVADLELEATTQGHILPGEAFEPDHVDYQTVLDQLIDQRLLAQESLRRGLDEEPIAVPRLKAARERILSNLLIEELVARNVSEDAIRKMYAEQVRLQQLDDEVRISLITVADQDAGSQVVAELAAGAEFSATAFKYSIDASSRIDGGDLGYIGPAEQPEPFASTIANTAVGEVSPLFESEAGWHVLKVEDRRQIGPKTLEEMRPEIVTFLTYSQINDVLGRMRAVADIKSPNTNPADRPDTAPPQSGTP
jgi:peptidyl-prolyl cis-trans isomerase C